MPRNTIACMPTTRRLAFCLASLLAGFALLAGAAGCSLPWDGPSKDAGTTYGMPAELDPNAASAQEQPAEQTKQVKFPAGYFALFGVTNPEACIAGLGGTNISAQEDGSYVATMPLTAHAAVVEDVYELVKATVDGIAGSEKYPNVTAVDYDEQFATVTVLFSGTSVSAEETVVSYVPGEAAVVYQTVAGLPVGCDVILVGADGSELMSTLFPQATQDLAAPSTSTSAPAEPQEP